MRFKPMIYLFLFAFLLACSSKNEETTKKEEPKEKPKFALKIKADDLKVLPEVIGFMGTNEMLTTFGQIEKTINPMLPQPLLIKELWLRQYAQFNLKIKLESIDLEKPIRFVEIADQQKRSTVQILAIINPEDVKKQMGENLKQEGDLYVLKQYANDPMPLYFYIDPTWNTMVSSDSATALDPKYRSFYLDLFQTQFNGLGEAYSYPKHLLKLWDGDLGKQIGNLNLKGDDLTQEKQKNIISSLMSTAQNLAQSSERIVFTIVLTDGEFQVRGKWTPTKDSALATTAKELSLPIDHELLSKAPINTPLFASLKLPPAIYQSMTKALNQNPSQPLAQNADLFAQYINAVTETTQALDGELLLLARQIELTPEMINRQKEQKQKDKARKEAKELEKKPNKTPKKTLKNTEETTETVENEFPFKALQTQALSIAVLFGLKDAKLAREKQDLLLSFYQKPELSDLLRKLGVFVEVLDDEQKIGDFQSKRIVGKMARLPAFLKVVKEQLKEIYDAHILITDQLGLVAFGTSWLESLQGFGLKDHPNAITGGLKEDKAVKRAFEKGAKNPFFMFFVEPIKTMSSLKQGNGGEATLALQLMFSHVKNDEGIAISLGASEDQYEAVFDLPMSVIKTLLLAFTGAGGSGLTEPIPTPELPPAGQGLDQPTLPPAGQGLDQPQEIPVKNQD